MRSRFGLTSSHLFPALLFISACSSGSSTVPPLANLTYGDAAPVYATCTAIAVNLPMLGSGSASSFAVSPALPAGLTLDASTGAISGTPLEALAATTFTITAASSAGETTFDLVLQVDSSLASGISYGGASLANLVDVAASFTPTIESGSATVWSITSGELPAGLTLDPDTGEISGTPTELGAHTFTVAASNCESTPAEVELELDVQPWFPSSMYVTNDEADGTTISSALWDARLESMRATGFGNGAGTTLSRPLVHPDGLALFVADDGVSGVQQYALDPVNGRISASATTTDLPFSPADLALTPDGRFLYAACSDGNVYQFEVDPLNHALIALSPFTTSAGSAPLRFAMHPGGGWLFLIDDADFAVRTFALDGKNGQLTLSDTTSGAIAPDSLSISPSGGHLYATSTFDSVIHGYSFDSDNGTLTVLQDSPFGMLSQACFDLVFDTTGAHAYAPNSSSGLVLQYDVDRETGNLTLMQSNFAEVEASTLGIAIDPRGQRVYVPMSNHRIQVLDMRDDGTLSMSSPAAMVLRPGARNVVFTKTSTPREVASGALYAISYGENRDYNFDLEDGVLSPMSIPHETGSGGNHQEAFAVRWMNERIYDLEPGFVIGSSPLPLYAKFTTSGGTHELAYDGWSSMVCPTHALAIDSSERFGFGVCDTGIVETSFNSSGHWLVGSTLSLSSIPDDIAVHPGGSRLLATDPQANRLYIYGIDPHTGALTPSGERFTSNDPVETLVTPDGRFVYVVCRASSQINTFVVDVGSGTAVQHSAFATPTLAGEVDAAMSPDGRFLAVLSSTTGVEMFSINMDPTDPYEDGRLYPITKPPGTAFTPVSLEFDSSGRHLYVGLMSGGIETFGVDAEGFTESLGVTLSGDGALDLALRLFVR